MSIFHTTEPGFAVATLPNGEVKANPPVNLNRVVAIEIDYLAIKVEEQTLLVPVIKFINEVMVVVIWYFHNEADAHHELSRMVEEDIIVTERRYQTARKKHYKDAMTGIEWAHRRTLQ